MSQHIVPDGRLAYYEFRDGKGDDQRFIQFPLLTLDLPDAYGNPRLDSRRLVCEGSWLTSNSLNYLMGGLAANYSWQFEVLYCMPAGLPYLSSDERITEASPPFQPSSTRHAIIVRTVNIGNTHWVALAHFHALNRLVFFDSHGTRDVSRSNDRSSFSIAVKSQLRFISGSEDEQQRGKELLTTCQRDLLQKDGWSCGLWCMGFVCKIIELLSERRALDGEEIDYERLVLELEGEIQRRTITRLSVEEAHRLARTMWVSQQEPNNLY